MSIAMESSTVYHIFDDEDKKSEQQMSFCSSNSMSFLKFVVECPPLSRVKSVALYCIMRLSYMFYALFFLVLGVIEFIYRFTDYFWLLHVTMLIKLIVLRIALACIKQRIDSKSETFFHLLNTSIPFGKKYFIATSFCNSSAMIFQYAVWSKDYLNSGWINFALTVVFVCGTFAYTTYSTAVLMVSITDAKASLASIEKLVKSSKQGQITSEEYSTTYEEIKDVVNKGFYLNGTLMITMLSNTVAAIVLMLMYERITDGENTLHAISFTIYVLVVQCATDVVFLYILLPEISSVNEMAMHLHLTTASQRWITGEESVKRLLLNMNSLKDLEGNNDEQLSLILTTETLAIMEANRYDTLHRIIAQPIRYTIASIYYTKTGARNQVAGVIGAVAFFFVRVIISLMIE